MIMKGDYRYDNKYTVKQAFGNIGGKIDLTLTFSILLKKSHSQKNKKKLP